jgi:carbonic anhydrase
MLFKNSSGQNSARLMSIFSSFFFLHRAMRRAVPRMCPRITPGKSTSPPHKTAASPARDFIVQGAISGNDSMTTKPMAKSPPSSIAALLKYNKEWSAKVRAIDPDYFPSLEKQQSPQYLYIGCADSRVTANTIVGLAPGEIFVHRNIANVVARADLNCLSVLQYAVDVLHVEHVIVCGHHGCGGVKAALDDARVGLADSWILNVKDVKDRFWERLRHLPHKHQHDALCELNAISQMANLVDTLTIRDAWFSPDHSKRRSVDIHCWVYGLHDGILHPLVHLTKSCNVHKKVAAAVDETFKKFSN